MSWVTKENIVMVVVLILAMMVHYHFIKTRLQAQTEEALKVSILHGSDTGHNGPLPLHQDKAAGTDRGGTQGQYPPWL